MTDYRPPYRAAVVSGLGVFALYLLTLSPSTAMWDTSEYIATAHILGIPHPPGNPLFVVLAKSWSILLAPLGLSVAVRINILAALTSAAAAGFYFLVAHRLLWGYLRSDGPEPADGGEKNGEAPSLRAHPWTLLAGTGAAVLLSATAFTLASCPWSRTASWPLASHTRTVLSELALASLLPAALKATETTPASCPFMVIAC